MKAWLRKKGTRAMCFALCLVFTALGALSWVCARRCWLNGWYEASPYAGNGNSFADSDYATDYMNDVIYYVYQYIQWQGTITADVVAGYGGAAAGLRITDTETGQIVLDTRGGSYAPVYLSVTANFTEGGTAKINALNDSGHAEAVSALAEHTWEIDGFINLPVERFDGCYAEYIVHETLLSLRLWFIPAAIAFLLLALGFAVWLLWSALRGGAEARRWLDRVPVEAVVVVTALLALALWAALSNWGYSLLHQWQGNTLLFCDLYYGMLNRVLKALFSTAAVVAVLWDSMRRCGQRMLRKSSLCARIPAAWRTAVLLALGLLFGAAWLWQYWSGTGYGFYVYIDLWLILALLSLLAAGVHAVILAVQLGRLNKGARSLAAGQLDAKVPTRGLVSGLREQGEALNCIGAGMKTAVDEKMKGERFKTELITNVSHDLKTPLTSIVSYVDLLKKENVPSPTAREYIEVIDRQSAKLKKLTEDLVEASRASSGAIAVHPEPTDVRELLSQSVGEYTERLALSGVEAVMALPESGVVLDTDGRLLWRVLENLTQNIVKYAQPGTRAYFDLTSENGHVTIALKNTSAEALNIPAEELMERFVRGDVSRHTEGSGLGLSIAQSLTELLGGTMALYLDGDLFKVTLSFDGARES